jgi:DNA-binding transcriptional ArsR family regulator
VLLDAGAVARRPDGRRRVYQLDAAPLQGVHDWTAEYEEFWGERLNRLRRHLDQ